MTRFRGSRQGTPFEFHHYYYGLVIATGGFILLFWDPIPGAIAGGLGLWIAGDDLVQHLVQHWRPGYLSPWHRWFYAGLEWLVRHARRGSPLQAFLGWLKRL